MTNDVQNRAQETEAKTDELTVEQLEQVAGGGTAPTVAGVDIRPSTGFYGTGVYKTTDGGRDG